MSLDVETVLSWLPADTETVFVAQGPFKPTPQDPRVHLGSSLLNILQSSNLSLLAGPEEGRRFKQVLARTVLLAVEGSRRFRAPSGLGGVLYEGCEIVELKDDTGQERELLTGIIQRTAKRKEAFGDVEVFVYQEKLEADVWTTFVANPKPKLFLAATNKEYLKEVLDRMSHGGVTRALPDNLTEWKYVDRGASFWALRHFDRQGALQDPTSPFGGKKGANAPDEQAQGVAFSFFPATAESPRIRYFSKNPDAVRVAREFWSWSSEGLSPEVRQSEPGVVEITIPIKDDQAFGSFLLVLFTAFGHGVFL